MGDGEKLLTHLNSALKVLLGLDIFPRVPKKKVKFCCPVLLATAKLQAAEPVLSADVSVVKNFSTFYETPRFTLAYSTASHLCLFGAMSIKNK